MQHLSTVLTGRRKIVVLLSLAILGLAAVFLIFTASDTSSSTDTPVFVHIQPPQIPSLYYWSLYSGDASLPAGVVLRSARLQHIPDILQANSNSTIVGEIELPFLAKLQPLSDFLLLPYSRDVPHSSIRLFTRKETNISSPRELKGGRIALATNKYSGLLTLAALNEKFGINHSNTKIENAVSMKAKRMLFLKSVDAAVIVSFSIPKAQRAAITPILRPQRFFEDRFEAVPPRTVYIAPRNGNQSLSRRIIQKYNHSVVRSAERARDVATNLSYHSESAVGGIHALANASRTGLQRFEGSRLNATQFLLNFSYRQGYLPQKVTLKELL